MNEVKKFFLAYHIQLIICCCILSAESIKLSPCANWDKNGIIVAGTGGRGSELDQLNDPEGVFIHRSTNTLYVADTGNQRIQMFFLNQLSNMGTTVISNVTYPTKVFVDDDNNDKVIYVALRDEGRIKKWTNGASEGVEVGGECLMCESVWVDKEKSVYMTSVMMHSVYKWSPRTNTKTVVAGRENFPGAMSDSLNSPEGIYVDNNSGTVYVADYANNRVQKWLRDAPNGTTVAGFSTGEAGSDAEGLSYPSAVRVDDETQVVYVADSSNNRIQRWLPNAILGETIAGGSGWGDALDRFEQPIDLDFDNYGNLYVCDRINDRVLMFKIVDNEPCFQITTSTLATDLPPVFSHFASALMQSSPQFFRPNSGSSDLYYYEAIEVNVFSSGVYSLTSVSDINTMGYLYEQSFDIFYPTANLLSYSDNGGVGQGFRIEFTLLPSRKYILIVTTSKTTQTGDFWISSRGPDSVNFKPMVPSTGFTTKRPDFTTNTNNPSTFSATLKSSASAKASFITMIGICMLIVTCVRIPQQRVF